MGVGFTAPPLTDKQRDERREQNRQAQLKAIYGVCRTGGHLKTPQNTISYEGGQYCAACVASGAVVLTSQREVYFITDGAGHVKIGFASNVGARMDQLQSGNVLPLTLLATLKGGPTDERALHKRFAAHRVRGEWFRLTPEIVDYITSLEKASGQ